MTDLYCRAPIIIVLSVCGPVCWTMIVCFRPDGRIDQRSDVPKEPMSWVVGAFSVSTDHGLGVMPQPYRVGLLE